MAPRSSRVAGLAGLDFAGYLRAGEPGLTSSRCILRDTRLVLAYLALVGLVAMVGLARQAAPCRLSNVFRSSRDVGRCVSWRELPSPHCDGRSHVYVEVCR